MISSTSAKAIADAYHSRYTFTPRHSSSSSFKYYRDTLYDFLYVNGFEAWLLNAFKAVSSTHPRALREFIMRIHTGESLSPATPNWSWPQRLTFGQRILVDLAQSLIRERHTDPKFETYGDDDKQAVDAMQRALELDGYIFRDGILWIPEASVIQEGEEVGVLEGLMKALQLPDVPTLQHHLKLSTEHYQQSRWDDSIANSRKVLEGVLQQAAARHASAILKKPLSPEMIDKPVTIRDYLEREGLLEKKEKDAISKVYGLLSETGGHPYIAARDQARLMRHLALTFAQFVLLRLEGAFEAQPRR